MHDIALKAAETDATKRALATFGKPFGLELYRGGGKATTTDRPLPDRQRRHHQRPCPSHIRVARQIPSRRSPCWLPPDDTTPIPAVPLLRPPAKRLAHFRANDAANGRRDAEYSPQRRLGSAAGAGSA